MSEASETTWLPIPGFPNYLASSEGEVFSKPRPRAKNGLLKQPVQPRGYRAVTMYADGVSRKIEVHKVIALAFHGPRPDGMETRHLDGDHLNNRASNLAYGTPRENKLDRLRHGTDPNARKTHCPQGHPYDAENTRRIPSRPTARYCRECDAQRHLIRGMRRLQ